MSEIDLGRVKRNVAKMVSMGAPEADIDQYIAGEGSTVDAVRAFKPDAPKQSALPAAVRAGIGLGAGILQRGVGVIQAGADIVGADDWSKAAGEVKKNIDRDVASLGTSGEVGRFVGDAAPALLIPGGAATMTGRAAASGIAGAVEGFTRAEEDSSLRDRAADGLTGLATGAVAAPVVEKTAQAVTGAVRAGKQIAKGVVAKSPEAWDDVGRTLKDKSQATFKKMTDAGEVIKKGQVNAIVRKLENALSSDGKLNADLHRNTISVLKDIQARRNGPMTFEEAQQYRQLLNDAVQSGTDVSGKVNQDARKALILIDQLDEGVEAVGGSGLLAKQARQEWGQYRRFEKVRGLVERFGDNPGVLRNQVKNLLLNAKAIRGYSDEEKEVLRALSKKGGLEGWLRLAGRAGIDLQNPSSNIIPLLVGGATSAVGDVATGGAVTAGATAAKYASKALTRGQSDEALAVLSGQKAPAAAKSIQAPAGTGAAASSLVPDSSVPEEGRPAPKIGIDVGPPNRSTSKQEEGFRPSVYKDTVGKRTVGKGFNMQAAGAKKVWEEAGIEKSFNAVLTGKEEITEEEADRIHDVVYGKAQTAAAQLVKGFAQLSSARKDAIQDLIYQVGEGEAKKFAPTLKLIERGNFAAAAERLLKAKVAKQTPSRAQRNAYMLANNVSREQAEKALVASGKIKPNDRIYA